ncbi:MAG: selenide, water dikinase SelD [Candidatus Neomarinimicrobiota bacterium]
MGPEDLRQILGGLVIKPDRRTVVGFEGADDAAVFRLDDGKLLLQTVDFFTPVVDDPYRFGQIAAANSLSDIYAMGGTPLFALNIVGFPIDELPHEMLTAILQGGIDKAAEAGIAIVGGHSIDDREPKYGLVVTGEVREADLLTNAKARPGDALILTKPLGTGIIATAIKRGLAGKEIIEIATRSMSTLNNLAATAARQFGAHAVTDVSGFGLLGHLGEMCAASGVSARIDYTVLPFLPEVRALAEQNVIPGGSRRNLAYAEKFTGFSPDLTAVDRIMIADAQTSGGLIIALPAEQASLLLAQFNQANPFPAIKIGEVLIPQSRRIIVDP